jgi:hypothetical protein
MEGFLTQFKKERVGEIYYCVLEEGLLKCLDKPEGNVLQTIELTRHKTRIAVLQGICPNRFALCCQKIEIINGKFKATEEEFVYCFAAPNQYKLELWSAALYNWRGRSFDDLTEEDIELNEVNAKELKALMFNAYRSNVRVSLAGYKRKSFRDSCKNLVRKVKTMTKSQDEVNKSNFLPQNSSKSTMLLHKKKPHEYAIKP